MGDGVEVLAEVLKVGVVTCRAMGRQVTTGSCGRCRDQAIALSSSARWRIIQAADRPRQASAHSGAGIGIHIPLRNPPGNGEPDTGTRTRNALHRSLRCLGERGLALLTGRWRALQHITLSPSKTGDIARAALILTHFEHGHIT